MRNKILLVPLLLVVLICFCSCEDPLGAGKILEPEVQQVISPRLYDPSNLTYHSVDLSWTEYKGGDFERYELFWNGRDPAKDEIYIKVKYSDQTQIRIDDLTPNSGYSFFVRLVNKRGDHADSKSIGVWTLKDYPSAIKYIKIEKDPIKTEEDIYLYTISWDKYVDDRVVPFSRYEIYFSKESYFTLSDKTLLDKITSLETNNRKIDVKRFEKNTTYYFTVRTYNILEKFAQSGLLIFTIP